MKIIGISVRTTNQNGQAMQDIGNLWQRFFSEHRLPKGLYRALYLYNRSRSYHAQHDSQRLRR